MSSNVEQCGETGEREGEAQNTTLHDKFSIFIKNIRICLKISTVLLSGKMGVFRKTFVTEIVEEV